MRTESQKPPNKMAVTVDVHSSFNQTPTNPEPTCPKINPISSQVKTSADTVVHASVLSSPQHQPSVVRSTDTTVIQPTSNMTANLNTSSATNTTTGRPAGSTTSNETVHPDHASHEPTPADKTDVTGAMITQSNCSEQVSSVKRSISGMTSPSSKPSYAIQVKFPSDACMEDIDITGILKQVQNLIKSGVLKVTGTKTQVLTVDIGSLKMLVSVVPKTPKQHGTGVQGSSQSTSQTPSSSGTPLEQGIPGTSSEFLEQTPFRTSSNSQSSTSDVTPIGTLVRASLSSPVRASQRDMVMASSCTQVKGSPKCHVIASSGTATTVSSGTPRRASCGTPVRSSARIPVRTSSRTPVRASPRYSSTGTQSPVNTVTGISSSDSKEPAVRQSPRFVSHNSPATKPHKASGRKKSSKSKETIPQVDGASDEKPEEDSNNMETDIREKRKPAEKRYTFGRGLGAPPMKGLVLFSI